MILKCNINFFVRLLLQISKKNVEIEKIYIYKKYTKNKNEIKNDVKI